MNELDRHRYDFLRSKRYLVHEEHERSIRAETLAEMREYETLAITGGPRVTPVTPMTPGTSSFPPSGGPPEIETPLAPNDWRSFVSSGDNLMRRRRTDEAIDAYAEALEVAQANPKGVVPAEFGRVCMSLGALQIQNGSPAEARRTLIEGRQFLLRNKGPAGTISQIEEVLKKLPRD